MRKYAGLAAHLLLRKPSRADAGGIQEAYLSFYRGSGHLTRCFFGQHRSKQFQPHVGFWLKAVDVPVYTKPERMGELSVRVQNRSRGRNVPERWAGAE